MRDIYFSSKEPFVGVYMLFRPVLLFRDPELVKRVLITDFDHFHDRGVHHDPVNDPIGANLFGMTGTKWKELRTRLTPSFSSGKLKLMFNVIQEKSHLLTDHLNHVLESTNEVHLKHPVEHLLISTIASNFFGFEFNAFENPDHEFTNMGSIFFEAEDIRSKLTFTGFFLLPELMKLFKLSMLSKQVSQFALNLVKSVVETRKNDHSTVRNDFMQTMIEMMKKDSENGTNTMSIESCTAQAFLFYTAGMDTSATTITFCIYELSKCPEWMEKVQEEVDAMMKKRNGKVLYDDLPEMKILDLCIKEALRMYPGLSVLNRLCTKEYRIPGTDHVVPEGTPVIISNLGMHMDEQFYADPETFDPSRFESSAKDVPYYPMGAGNRNCLGGIERRTVISLHWF